MLLKKVSIADKITISDPNQLILSIDFIETEQCEAKKCCKSFKKGKRCKKCPHR
jgi:hypothetical protein